MLVLSRKVGEVICIGDSIRITITEICSPSKVRIGIEAPRDVTVDRLEVRQSKEADRAAE